MLEPATLLAFPARPPCYQMSAKIIILILMSLNCAEIEKVLDELPLAGSFVQDIVQPSYDSLALSLYSPRQGEVAGAFTLFICLAHGACRLNAVFSKVPKFEKPLRFMEFLRSKIRGARIEAASQPGFDRIVRIALARKNEKIFLYIRLWSAAANIIAADNEGKILDVFYRRPARGEVSGGTWNWQPPNVSSIEDAPFKPRDFAALLLKDLDEEKAKKARCALSESAMPYSLAIDLWHAEHAAALSRDGLVEEAQKKFGARVAKLEAGLEKMEAKRKSFLKADSLRHLGDLLTANLWAVKPGDAFIEVEDYEAAEPGRIVRIVLNPRLTAQENAAYLYSEYKKATSGLAELELSIEAAKKKIEELKGQLAAIEKEENPLAIRKMLRTQLPPQGKKSGGFPGPVFRKAGWLILVGRSAAENDELLRRHVRGQDLWLHARDWKGGYVFIKSRSGKTVPQDILLDAAALAIFYSKGRGNGEGDVYCTQVKHLRRAKGAPRGTVLPSNEKNLYIKVSPERLRALELCREE